MSGMSGLCLSCFVGLTFNAKLSNRLKFQHRVLKEAAGGRILFPPVDPEKTYFVLDSGVGPGSP